MNGGTSIESATGAFGAARLAEWKATNQNAVGNAPSYVAPGVIITGGTPIYSGGNITNLKDLTFAANATPAKIQDFISGGICNVQEYWMIDRSFVKLREVTLGYSLPQSIISKSKYFKAVSFALVGRNLLYFAARKDIDLDQFASGYNDSDRSLNNGGLLQSVNGRRFGFNIKLSF